MGSCKPLPVCGGFCWPPRPRPAKATRERSGGGPGESLGREHRGGPGSIAVRQPLRVRAPAGVGLPRPDIRSFGWCGSHARDRTRNIVFYRGSTIGVSIHLSGRSRATRGYFVFADHFSLDSEAVTSSLAGR